MICIDCTLITGKKAVVAIDGRHFTVQGELMARNLFLRQVRVVNPAFGYGVEAVIAKNGCEGHDPAVLVNTTGTPNDDVVACNICGSRYVHDGMGNYQNVNRRERDESAIVSVEALSGLPSVVFVPLYSMTREYKVRVPKKACGEHTPRHLATVLSGDKQKVFCGECYRVYEPSEDYRKLLLPSPDFVRVAPFHPLYGG
jgi:hypothetical protein